MNLDLVSASAPRCKQCVEEIKCNQPTPKCDKTGCTGRVTEGGGGLTVAVLVTIEYAI